MPASKYSINYIWSKASLRGLIPFSSRSGTTAKTPELGHIITDVWRRNVEIYIKYENSCLGCIRTKSGNALKTAVLPFISMEALHLCCRNGSTSWRHAAAANHINASTRSWWISLQRECHIQRFTSWSSRWKTKQLPLWKLSRLAKSGLTFTQCFGFWWILKCIKSVTPTRLPGVDFIVPTVPQTTRPRHSTPYVVVPDLVRMLSRQKMVED